MIKTIFSTFITTLILITPLTAKTNEDTFCSDQHCYQVITKLGQGAFGKVYSVQDENGQLYAMKVYPSYDPQKKEQSHLLADGYREFTKGQILSHPNIIKSVEFFFDNDNEKRVDHTVLQFVEGSTLSKISPMTKNRKDAVKAAKQFIDALLYALTLELIHIDLHPGNVMMTNSSDVMIIDLASFFTFDELIKFIEGSPDTYDSNYDSYSNYSSDSDYSSDDSTTYSYSDSSESADSFDSDSYSTDFSSSPDFSTRRPIIAFQKDRQNQLKEFFARNPILEKQLRKMNKKTAVANNNYEEKKKAIINRCNAEIFNFCIYYLNSKFDFTDEEYYSIRNQIESGFEKKTSEDVVWKEEFNNFFQLLETYITNSPKVN